ncbi:MAG: autotransporter-associated beta strand repeat-containing protein [Verrucomicrobiae bacterium]|nr:autotransporter-associated beta strand repeat-containing protein [Verrucomicrobiae bacterium]
MKNKYMLACLIVCCCVGLFILLRSGYEGNSGHETHLASTDSPKMPTNPIMAGNPANSAIAPKAAAASPKPLTAGAITNVQARREFDLAVNPYAGGLREPGRSKREWPADYLKHFQSAKAGDPVKFELTDGVPAEGRVKIIQVVGSEVSYVSGVLTAPEAGTFFFLTPPAGGKAGKAVGVVEFPASKTAYRIEPTGPNGDPELWRRRLDEVICLDLPAIEPVKLQAAAQAGTNETENITPVRPDLVPAYTPSYNSNIVSLQSYPGSPAVLLLDFAGGYTASWGGVSYARPPVGNDTIKDVWKRVAEDYLPFNINVTTDFKVFQAAPAASRQRCCFTTTPITAAGVAYEGSWNWGNDTVCWSVYYVGKAAAEVGAHEPGHTLGLSHETQDIPNGTNAPTHNEYFTGQGSGATGWCPIMGAAYYQPVTTWAHGEYLYAGNLEDQLNIIATANNNVTYRVDDTGSTLANARYLEIYTNYTAFAEGVIEQTADTDAFQFTTTGGAVSLTAKPVGDWADLAMTATLADATDTLIASNNPQNVLSASIATNLPAGTYTFRVTGAGRNDPLTTGFSSYSSLGYYSITGSVAGARMPTRLSVPSLSPNGTVVGPVPPNGSGTLAYAIVGGNPGGAFAINNGGVLTVANNSPLNYNQLVTNAQYFAGLEVFVNITNQSNPLLTEINRRVVVSVLPTPPVLMGFTTNVMEHIPPGLAIGFMSVSNLGMYTDPTFSIVAGNTSGMFAVDNGGVIITAGDLNAAGQPVYNLTVAMNDNGVPVSMSATGQVTINIVGNSAVTWTGSGGNNNWSSSGNWSSPLLGVGPRVTFGTAVRQVNANDAASSLTWARFTTGGFTISGNPVMLQSGITNAGNNTWGLATSLHAPQTWYATSGILTVNGLVANDGYGLNAGGPGGLVFNGQMSGSGVLTKIGAGTLALANSGNSFTGDLVVSNGTVVATVATPNQNPTTSPFGNPQVARTVTVNSGSTLAFGFNDILGRSQTVPVMSIVVDGGMVTNTGNYICVLGPITLKNGALLTGNGGNSASYQMFALHGKVTVAGTSPSTITSGPAANSGYHLFAPTVFDVAEVTGNAGVDLTVSGTLIDRNGDWTPTTGSLTKTGAGTLALNAANTYTGPTTVSNGTLLVNGSLSASSAVAVMGGTLAGTGIINGPTSIQAGGMLAPGTNGIGTLKINNTLTLGGTVLMEISKNGIILTNDFINGISTLTCGGAFVVTNVGPSALAAGDQFAFFTASGLAGTFNSIALPLLSPGLAWDLSNLYVNGSIKIIAVGSGSPPPVPAGVTVSLAGLSQINVDWSAAAGAINYVINRDGVDVFTVAGTHFSDAGLALNSSHCYTLVAVGSGGSSAPSASVCGSTVPVGATLAWDADSTTSGVQAGSGAWGGQGTNWLMGGQDLIWYDNDTAVFGGSPATNCTVTLANDVVPAGLTFNATGGGSYTISGTNNIVTVASPVITTVGNATIATPITGAAGAVTKTGAGQLTLANSGSSFTGNVVVSNGTLLVNVSSSAQNPVVSALGNPQVARTVTVNNGARLVFGASDVFGQGLTQPLISIVLDGGVLTNTGNSFDALGPVTLKNGALLTGYGGGDVGIQMFALHGNVAVAGTSPSTIASGPGNYSGYHLNAPTVFDVADVTGNAGVDLTVSGTLIDRDRDWQYISSAGSLTKIGAGTLALANSGNSFTGDLVVSNGTVVATAATAGQNPTTSPLGNPQVARTVTVSSGATLAFANENILGYSQTVPVMAIVVDGGTVTNTGNYNCVLGPITLKNGALLTGNGGRSAAYQMFDLQGKVTVAGTSPSTITSGPAVNSGYHLFAPTLFEVAEVTGDAGVDLTVSGTLIDRNGDWTPTTGSLTKTGAGTLALNAANTYTGPTTVSNGTLLVNGSLSAGSAVTVMGGTLAGTGIINGPTSIQAGGMLAPGTNGIGTLKINNTLTFSSTSTALMEVNLSGGVANNDFVTGLSGVAYGGALIVTNTGASPLPAGAVFCLFNAATPGRGNFSSVTILPGGTGSFNPTNGQLTIGPGPTNNVLGYESFPYPAGASLASLNGGYGWNGGWQAIANAGALGVNGGSLVAGGTAPSGYDALATGNSALVNNGGRAGRWLDTTLAGPFGTHGFIDGNGRIGADGKVLYVSFLEQASDTSGSAFYEFEFHRGDLGDPGRIAGIGNDTGVANSVNLRAPGTVNNLSLGTATTAVNLYVLKIVYHAGNDDVYVYRNPTGATESANVPALIKLAQADMSFDGLSIAAAHAAATIKVDEIRLGESWASVTVPKVYSPRIDFVNFSGGNVVLTGSGGAPGSGYTWLTATNVAAPSATWTTNSAGLFDGSGAFSNSIPVIPAESGRYFRLRIP